MKKTLIGLATAGLLAAPVASAETAYLNGIAGLGPQWSTITLPGDIRVDSSSKRLRWDNVSTKSSAAAAGMWMDAHDVPGAVLVAYSEGAVGAQDARALRPDWQGTVVEVGSPANPNNGNAAWQGGRPILAVGGGQIDYVSLETDPVAHPGAKGSSLMTHLTGYNGRNFSTETPTSTSSPASNVTSTTYAKPSKPARAKPATTAVSTHLTPAERRAERRAIRATQRAIRYQKNHPAA